ncbi:MAG TPA: hypothetical protein VJW23_10805 [Propionibacteriaceae bacterium]|nr:hypothetical protein [Propionibacteriaceae bacterium]
MVALLITKSLSSWYWRRSQQQNRKIASFRSPCGSPERTEEMSNPPAEVYPPVDPVGRFMIMFAMSGGSGVGDSTSQLDQRYALPLLCLPSGKMARDAGYDPENSMPIVLLSSIELLADVALL